MAIPKLCLLKQPDQNTDGNVYTEQKKNLHSVIKDEKVVDLCCFFRLKKVDVH